MKIASSDLALLSSRVASESHEERESLQIWRSGGARETQQSDSPVGLRQAASAAVQRFERSEITVISISREAIALQPQQAEVSGEEAATMTPQSKLEYSILKLLVERLTGEEITVYRPEDVAKDQELNKLDPPPTEGGRSNRNNEAVGWGVRYDYYESHQEIENTQFHAEGVVHTQDGKEIDIEIALQMSRHFQSSESISIRAGDALKDPLVLNFEGRAADLTQTKYSFDIDADGREDQISFVGPQSGFLALDRNNDGEINDGTELFGAISGDGFADLAAYDLDHNQWIDENDSIFDNLRIWSKDADGKDHLAALGDRNVGAIYLGHVSTEFKIADAGNQQLGQVRETGIFLEENGNVGTVQKIDLIA